uniref:Odorant receptor 22 n=1 Tax=Holotrichia parallela TaxID=93412 RepID=A0A2P9JY61_HOLPA|nr:odorant receptor 22 [Holotrichia parallela]
MAAATVTTTFECLVRFYIIAFKKPEINDIIFKIWRKFWPVMVVSPKKMEQLIRKCYTALILTVGCYGPAILCNSIATLWPYLSNRELILRSVYPFDWNQTYVYEVIYIWQYVTQWYILILVNTFDFFMIPVVMVCTVQFGILQDVFKNILSQKSRRQRLLIFGDVISDRDMILRCLDHQQMLISICNQLEEIFRFAILFQFVTSTAALCSSALMLQVDSSHFMEMLTFVIAHMFQLFYYCFVGSELISYSENMANAIYKCNWHLSDNREFMKALTLILQRCQKPQRLTAVGIVDLNFVSYLTVLRVAFSFYTLLTKVIDRGTSWT